MEDSSAAAFSPISGTKDDSMPDLSQKAPQVESKDVVKLDEIAAGAAMSGGASSGASDFSAADADVVAQEHVSGDVDQVASAQN